RTLLMHALPTAFAFGGGQPNVSRVNAVEAQTVVAGLNAVSPMAPAEAELLERVFPHVDLPLAEPADGVWTETHVSSQLTIPGNFGRPVTTQPTTRAGAALTGTPLYYSTNSGGINAFAGGSVSIWGQGNFTTATLESDGTISVDQPGGFFNRGSSGWQLALMLVQIVAILFGLALAGWLIAAGIRTLGNTSAGLRMHRVWLRLKLVHLALLFALTMWTVAISRSTKATITVDNQWVEPPLWEHIAWSFGYAVPILLIFAAYPVVVFFTMRSRVVRTAAMME
ncbi:MAG: hypothetical protein AAGI46_16850, partial [Planctomycetota bacterium]